MLCLPTDGNNREKRHAVLQYVAHQVKKTHNPEKAYSDLLHLVWEGILYEYLRTSGFPLRSANNDPRVFTLQMWRKQAQEQRAIAFKPMYVPRIVVTRHMDEGMDNDLKALMEGIEQKELFVKHSEAKIKKDHDYRNIVLYLAAVTDMHTYEKDSRDYLVGEVESLRSRLAHQQDSLEITMQQLDELEERHQKVRRKSTRRCAMFLAAA